MRRWKLELLIEVLRVIRIQLKREGEAREGENPRQGERGDVKPEARAWPSWASWGTWFSLAGLVVAVWAWWL